jgi:hypothetical protein
VVLVIIGMLASMVSFAMFRSMQAAREAKTQALIAKLHNVIARHWDTFETGQIPFTSSVSDPTDAQRLLAVREWMRYEMPDKEADLGAPTLIDRPLANEVIEQMGVPPEGEHIYSNTPGAENYAPEDARLLYRLVTLLADDDLDRINLFSENETKDVKSLDTDNNGEQDSTDGTPDIFIDGWGQPIRFIRWPAGLATDIQEGKSIIPEGESTPTNPDPFDPMKVGSPTGYPLFPLIYSHGPDKAGLAPSTTANNESNPFVSTYQLTSDDNDNIHNHRMNARLQ